MEYGVLDRKEISPQLSARHFWRLQSLSRYIVTVGKEQRAGCSVLTLPENKRNRKDRQ